MTNEKAIDKLMNLRDWLEESELRDSLDMAIEALEGNGTDVHGNNLIDRQAAIDVVEFEDKWLFDAKSHNEDTKIAFSSMKSKISELPSAHQEPRSPLYYGDGYSEGKMVYDSAECPNCGYIYDEGDQVWGEPYCPHCGQALDWYMRGEQDE